MARRWVRREVKKCIFYLLFFLADLLWLLLHTRSEWKCNRSVRLQAPHGTWSGGRQQHLGWHRHQLDNVLYRGRSTLPLSSFFSAALTELSLGSLFRSNWFRVKPLLELVQSTVGHSLSPFFRSCASSSSLAPRVEHQTSSSPCDACQRRTKLPPWDSAWCSAPCSPSYLDPYSLAGSLIACASSGARRARTRATVGSTIRSPWGRRTPEIILYQILLISFFFPSFRYTLNFTAAVFITLGAVFDFGVWYYVKDLKIFDEEIKEVEMQIVQHEEEVTAEKNTEI